jgi:hypothetical protein
MSSKVKDSNKIFLKDIINVIAQLDFDFNKALENLLNSQYTEIRNTFISEIIELIEIIESNKDPLDDNYLKAKQNQFNKIKENYIKYNEAILEIYENNYIKNIRENNEYLHDLINKIIPDFDPPNENSFSSKVNLNLPNFNNESSQTEQSGSLFLISGLESFYNEKIYKNQSKENFSLSFENNYFCTICHKEKAIELCFACNQLFCKACVELEKSEKRRTNNCGHDLQKIVNIKKPNEIGKVLYLNSLNNFFTKIILKSDYLLKHESQDLKLYNDSDGNCPDSIKKIFFEYPNMNITDDLTEKKYFESINNILENNLGIKNLDIKNFNIYEIDQKLVNLLKKFSKEDKQNQYVSKSTFDISINGSEDEDEDDYEKSIDDETFVKNEN